MKKHGPIETSHTTTYVCVAQKKDGKHVWRPIFDGVVQTTGGSRFVGPHGDMRDARGYKAGVTLVLEEISKITIYPRPEDLQPKHERPLRNGNGYWSQG